MMHETRRAQHCFDGGQMPLFTALIIPCAPIRPPPHDSSQEVFFALLHFVYTRRWLPTGEGCIFTRLHTQQSTSPTDHLPALS